MSQSNQIIAKPLILVVDDEPKNLQLLGAILDPEGYEVAFASSGHEALRFLLEERPDLILLDIMMPELDGFATLHAIRQTYAGEELPVLFVTARRETSDVIKGLSAGAQDYIAKPYQSDELLCRVKTQLTLKQSRDEQTELNSRLRQALSELESKNLILENLNRDKSNILAMASHDLRRSIGSVVGLTTLMLDTPDMPHTEATEILRMLFDEGRRMNEMVTSLIDVHRIEDGGQALDFQDIDLRECLSAIEHPLKAIAREKNITLELGMPEEVCPVRADSVGVRQILENLIGNAIKFTPKGRRVGVYLRKAKDRISVAIEDQGPGFQPQDMDNLFKKFARLSAKPTGGEVSTGLGLSIVKLLADAMGLTIQLEATSSAGSTFVVSFPTNQ